MRSRKLLQESDDLSPLVQRAYQMQKLGFDISFTFLPRFPDAPSFFICVGRHGKDEWSGSGYDPSSRSRAFERALGEVTEHTLWREQTAYWKENSIRSNMKTLNAPFLDISNIAGYSQEQRLHLDISFDADTPFLWTKGVRLDDDTDVHVPAQLVSARYASDRGDEPLLRGINTNGCAVSDSFDDAAYKGLQELIERDAFMITFFNRITPPRIDPASIDSEETRHMLGEMKRYGLECDILHLPTDLPSAVMASLVRDPTGIGPAFSLGARAHHDPVQAISGAIREAFGMWCVTRFKGLYKKEIHHPPSDHFRRIAYWAQPQHASTLSWLHEGPLSPLPKAHHESDVRTLAQALSARKYTAAAVAMSPPILRNLGLHAAFVVCPELQPLNLSDPPYLGGVRLRSVPQSLGYTPAESPPPYPHPFP